MAGKTDAVSLKWKVAVAILFLLCVGLTIAVLLVAVDFTRYKEKYPGKLEHKDCPEGTLDAQRDLPKSQAIFADLSSEELVAVRDFMLKQSALDLKRIDEATVKDNYIYLIQLLPPDKDMVLEYLDNNKTKPARKALVVVFQGSTDPAVVQEYVVSRLNTPEAMTYDKYGITLDFNVRPYDMVQEKAIEKIVLQATSKAFRLLNESYDGYCYANCTNKRLKFQPQTPFGKDRGERKTWLHFMRDIEGSYLNPVDFQLHIDFAGPDESKWRLESVYYSGGTYETIDLLMDQYNLGSSRSFIAAPKLQYDGNTPLFSSFARRGNPQPHKPMRPPRMFEPDGQRFSISGRRVKYMSWSFDFRMDSVSGPQLFDIRFNNERIIYELSLQEAISFYSGYSPYFQTLNFVYGGWTMGARNLELIGGVDCPETAKFFDAVHFVDSNNPKAIKNAVCVFELDSGIPLRRHFQTDGKGYKFYGGLVSHALVLRTIITVENYDSIFDFMFYQNGVVEVKATPIGYLLADNYRFQPPSDSSFGEKVHTEINGNLHDHIFHYKVDLDVHSRFNSFQTLEITTKQQQSLGGLQSQTSKIFRVSQKRFEKNALFKTINFDTPTFYNIYSAEENTFGSKKGYLIEPQSAVKQVLPENDYVTTMAPWSKYPLVVTKYRSKETKSSSLYNQNSPTRPIVDFPDFSSAQSNEDISNQDLVAWVSIGAIQIPTPEDVPNFASAANSARFFLRPFNYFNEDPSMGSTDAVLIRPDYGKDKNVVQAFGDYSREECFPRKYDINIKGNYKREI
ncbi:Amiloride-sensitive amine oxidase [copper-containing] [Acropora cervicornis]|uniref:Amine oxidase n=1 Tax=Acropora cervicornis TaxID=6130 RepID=A0AAD9QUH3_ACRCE|nr:Amiloride-sensitive amine oxidase [copper-containing] [Acropora cervicornis]